MAKSGQLTVKALRDYLNMLVKKGYGNKLCIMADDTEGNGYHGMFFTPTYDVNTVKECIEYSNGVYETDDDNPENLVIIG